MQVDVEVCVTSVEEALVAESLGATGVEVCTWLACGGLTPSSGLVDAIRSAVRVPVRVLIRPTPGNFVYSTVESLVLLTDAEIFGGGALGLVCGALDEHANLHVPLMRVVKEKAPESEITFHRAVDQAKDPLAVLHQCMDLGIDRILTSGGTMKAMDGIPVLAKLVMQAGDECMIAAAGGIGPENVVELIEKTGVREVHFAAQRNRAGAPIKFALSSNSGNNTYEMEPDRAKMEGVMNALVKAGFR